MIYFIVNKLKTIGRFEHKEFESVTPLGRETGSVPFRENWLLICVQIRVQNSSFENVVDKTVCTFIRTTTRVTREIQSGDY